MEDALFTYLTGDTNVDALVGDGVYPGRVPEGAPLPAISYGRVSAQRDYDYDPFEDTHAFVKARFTFHCWSNKSEEAMDVGEAVLLALSGYNGEVGGVLVGASFAVLEQDVYDGTSKMFRRSLDFMILYEEDLTPSS